MKLLLTLLRFGIAIALLIWLGFSGAIQWPLLAGLWAAWLVTLAAILLYFIASVITAWRLCVLLEPAGFHLTVFSSARLTLIGLFFGNCMPGAAGGDLVRIYYAAADNHGRRTELATIILLDRVVGLFAMLCWPLLAAPFFTSLLVSMPVLRGLLWAGGVAAAAMLIALLAGSTHWVRHGKLAAWCFRSLPLGRHLERILDTLHTYRRKPGALLAATAISILTHTLATVVMLLIGVAINPSAFSWQMAILVPLGFLSNQLPLTPGGLGVGEAAFSKLFRMAGLQGGAEIMLGWRVVMTLVSFIGLFFYLQGRRRFIVAGSAVVSPETRFST